MAKPRACKHDPLKPCRACIARRNRTRGLAKQTIVADLLEIPNKYRGQRTNEEWWQDAPLFQGWKFEVKSGKMPALITNALTQSQAAHKAIGNNHIYSVVVVPEGTQEPWIIAPLADLVNHIRGVSETGNSWNIRDLARAIRKYADEIETLTR